MGEALRVNRVLQALDLLGNGLGKAVGEALRANTVLQTLNQDPTQCRHLHLSAC